MGNNAYLLKKSTFLATTLVFCAIAAAVSLAAISQTPLYLVNSNQPNIMILLDNSGSMSQSVDGAVKIVSARRVVSNLVKSTSGVRFGLTIFNTDNGGRVVMKCGELTAANVDATVNAINAETFTPLGETLAEIWQYFKGSSSSYNSGVSYSSPITSSCQKSFVIIVTDGEPTRDFCYKGDFSTYGCDTSSVSRLAEVAKYMHEHPAVAAYPGSTITTYTVGFAVNVPILQTAATNGGGQYYTAANEAALASSLQSVVNTIIGMVSTATTGTRASLFLDSDNSNYKPIFDSTDWSGYLEAYQLDTATANRIGSTPLWEAGARLNSRTTASRVIYTAGTPSGNKRTDFTTTNQANIATAANFTNFSTNWISYVRGDAISGYRTRTNKLGDIIYSSPLKYAPPNKLYTDHDYQVFRKNNAARQSLVLVGANDGMLHAFNVDTGDEEWAFIPASLLNKLKLLRSIPYTHTNYVNGMITVGDAYIKSKNTSGTVDPSAAWHSIAVCGLREGGKSYFALDITDPKNPVPLWEINASSANGLGYSFGTPLILKLKDNSQPEKFRWVTVLPNGYEGAATSKAASLIIADLATGTILREIVVDGNTNGGAYQNGLATSAAVDVNNDGYTDYLYAGDLKGHLWKFDVTSDTIANWDVAWRKSGSPVALFKATDPGGAPQPITTRPAISQRVGYQIVFFGTGKYYETGDNATTQTQSFYGVYDDISTTATPSNAQATNEGMLTKSDLGQQTVTQVTSGGIITDRNVSNNPVGANGWYLNLPITGERVVTNPVAIAGLINFNTFVPSTDPCSSGGINWPFHQEMETGKKVNIIPPPGGIPGPPLPPEIIVTDDGTVVSIDPNDPTKPPVVIGKLKRFGVLSWRQLK
ncbi:pilus assembly protein [Geobacter sp. AOG1]|uniref:pilus assembly protein n=1 Tax=Geobacter sp. AOG1 TaxID=1566346 RepID=UPI001CC7A8AE|nr:PilC/PilY family type IV pilus protein [Geobacter sp. AOG1]GFE56959.1 pilus assembly protein PilY [Geobacter sp. AOG1]